MKLRTRTTGLWLAVVVLSLFIVSILLPGLAAGASGPQPPVDSPTRMAPKQPAPFRAGQILVAFKPAIQVQDRLATLSARGLSVVRQIASLDVSVVKVPAGSERAIAQDLARLSNVRYAEPDYLVQAFGTPDDPLFNQQWNMTQINAPAAWDVSTGSSATIIAILDTGIDLTHPDLQDKIVAGYDFVNDDTTAQDDEGHGSHCAGIAAASSDNGIGVAGVDWAARLMPVKVLDSKGSGSYSDVAAGIIWAADHGAAVASMSFGGSGESTTMRDAFAYASGRGMVLVAAAGNEFADGNATNYPAAYDHVIGVAATNSRDERASYSNTGFYVDVAAPGGDSGGGVLSTLWTAGGHTYGRAAGTSMATPHVAGLAALVIGVNPALTADTVEWVLESTAVDRGAPGRDDQYGWGRIDALAAVNAAGDPQPTPTPTPSTCLIESAHPYANNFTFTWTVTNPDGAAAWSRVHFARVETESGWDAIEILDGAGAVRQTITGDHPTGLWSDPIAGAAVQVRLRTDGSVIKWGFCLDAIESATPPAPTPTPTPSNCRAESAHPYGNGLNQSWSVTNPDTTAAYSRIHFSRLETEGEYDFVIVRAASGTEVARYSGALSAGVWSPVFPGATAQVQLTSDSSITAWGFCVDDVETTPAPAWSLQAPLSVPRSRLALAAVGDTLYAIGGEAQSAAASAKQQSKGMREVEAPTRLALDGVGALAIGGVVEAYDPQADAWTRRTDKPVAVSNVSAAVLGGQIYVAGGYTAGGEASSVVEVYDPATNSWSVGQPLPAGRFAYASAVLDGQLYVIGGSDNATVVRSVYRFDPAAHLWTEVAGLNVARSFAGAAAVGGKLFVVGGLDEANDDLASAEMYDPAANRWTVIPSMNVARGGPGVAGVGGKLYVAGGGWSSYLPSVEVYDPATQVWSTFDELALGRRTLGLAYLDGRLYAVGGFNGAFTGANESHTGPDPAPQVGLTPAGLSYHLTQGQTAQAAVAISNAGGADLSFTLSDELVSLLPVVQDAPWVAEAPAAGAVAPGASQSITVSIDTAGLDAGQHLAQLVVQSDDPARPRALVPISLTVESADPVTLSFSPSHSDAALGSVFRVDIMLATGTQAIDSVDTQISFDPRILQVVDAYGNPATQIMPGVDVPLLLVNLVDNAAGQIVYGAGRRLGDRAPAGTLRLATIRFRAVSQTVSPAGTPLAFGENCQVYFGGAGILGHAEEGSVIVQAPWFTGRVTLQGRGRAPSSRWVGYPITVTLLDDAGAPVRAFETTLDENGKFVLLTPPAGTFGVKVKGAHTLSNLRQGVTLPSPALIELGTLREGDVNNDDRVAGGDFSLLVTAYNTRAGEARWDARADLDGDGRIAVADFSLLASNYSLRGPVPLVGPANAPAGVGRMGSMELWIDPARRLVDPGDTFDVTVVLNAGDGRIDTVGTLIGFDPEILQVVDAAGNPTTQIIPGTALPTVVLNQVDNAAGRIQYDAGISLGSDPRGGRIAIGTIRFKALTHTSSGLQGTPIDFLVGTEAYLAGEPQLGQRTGAAVVVAVKVAQVLLPKVVQ